VANNSGDHDMAVPFLSTQAWIRSLNYSIVDDWRPWHTNGQVAGYFANFFFSYRIFEPSLLGYCLPTIPCRPR